MLCIEVMPGRLDSSLRFIDKKLSVSRSLRLYSRLLLVRRDNPTASVCLGCTRRSESRPAPSRKAHNAPFSLQPFPLPPFLQLLPLHLPQPPLSPRLSYHRRRCFRRCRQSISMPPLFSLQQLFLPLPISPPRQISPLPPFSSLPLSPPQILLPPLLSPPPPPPILPPTSGLARRRRRRGPRL